MFTFLVFAIVLAAVILVLLFRRRAQGARGHTRGLMTLGPMPNSLTELEFRRNVADLAKDMLPKLGIRASTELPELSYIDLCRLGGAIEGVLKANERFGGSLNADRLRYIVVSEVKELELTGIPDALSRMDVYELGGFVELCAAVAVDRHNLNLPG